MALILHFLQLLLWVAVVVERLVQHLTFQESQVAQVAVLVVADPQEQLNQIKDLLVALVQEHNTALVAVAQLQLVLLEQLPTAAVEQRHQIISQALH
jgi:mannitol/fructose-specific phosphotransferase system IIA component